MLERSWRPSWRRWSPQPGGRRSGGDHDGLVLVGGLIDLVRVELVLAVVVRLVVAPRARPPARAQPPARLGLWLGRLAPARRRAPAPARLRAPARPRRRLRRPARARPRARARRSADRQALRGRSPPALERPSTGRSSVRASLLARGAGGRVGPLRGRQCTQVDRPPMTSYFASRMAGTRKPATPAPRLTSPNRTNTRVTLVSAASTPPTRHRHGHRAEDEREPEADDPTHQRRRRPLLEQRLARDDEDHVRDAQPDRRARARPEVAGQPTAGS